MTIFSKIRQRRALVRGGYHPSQFSISASGQIIETATGREICPLALMPCEVTQALDGAQITFYQRNSNTPLGTAIAHHGDPA